MSDIVRYAALDKLAEHYRKGLSDDLLPTEEKQLLERLNFVDNLIRGCRSRKFCIEAVRKKFYVSQATAYRDYKDTKRFFGSMSLADKEYDRGNLEELAMKGVRMAMELGDLKAYFSGIREIRLIRGYGSEDFDKIPIEDLIKKQIIVQAAGSKGIIEINLDNATDIDFVDLNELLDQTSIFGQPVEDLQKVFVKKDGADLK
jgi:hypothetical protein